LGGVKNRFPAAKKPANQGSRGPRTGQQMLRLVGTERIREGFKLFPFCFLSSQLPMRAVFLLVGKKRSSERERRCRRLS
jgi:hypothetical protein